VDWFGGNGFVAPNKLPLLWLGEPYHTNQNSDPSTTFAFIAPIRQFGQDLAADGLGITLVDVFDNFDGHLEPGCLVDQVHPAKCGHQVISATYLGAMNWLFTKDQRIDFGTQSSANFSSSPIPVNANATSNLPVTLTVMSGNAAIENNALRAFSTGSVTLEADQGGDWNYLLAAPEQKTIQILPAPVTITVQPLSSQVIAPASTSVTVLVTWAGSTPVAGSVTLNDGSAVIGTAQLDGTGAATFSNLQLPAGTHTLTARYAQQGNFAAGVSTAVSVEVVKATPSISWATPSAIAYGTALGANQLNATSSVTGTFSYTPAAGTILSAGERTLSVTFTPTDTTNYTTATASVTLTVNQATPTLNWAAPAAITYGTALSEAQLNASSPVAGAFTYSRPAGMVLRAGSRTLSVTFTPTDTTNYATETSSVTLTVNQAAPDLSLSCVEIVYDGNPHSCSGSATGLNGVVINGTWSMSPATETAVGSYTVSGTFTSSNSNYADGTASGTLKIEQARPTINWAPPSVITYGTPLGANQLNATSPVAGTFAYTPVAGTVLRAGSQTLSVTFIPADTTNYSTDTKSVSLTVNKATPTISWANPAAITFGTALSTTQLNATASVPGAFVYSPAAGEMPPVGNDTLNVTFTPTDATDYTTATASVVLTVNNPLNPIPALNGISPAIANAGGAAFQLTVTGTGFVSGSTVFWGATALSTQYVSSSQLTAQVPATVIANAGNTAITVQSPTPVGGTSSSLQFEVDSASAANAPSFSTAIVTVTAGSTASYPATLPSSATDVSVTCLNLPSGAACSYSSAARTVSITTSSATPKGTYQVTVVFTETLPGAAGGFVLLPFLLLPLLFVRKKLTAQGAWFTACLCIGLLAGAIAVTGCGGSASNSPAPNPTHQVTSSGSVSLIVQ
jgi:hypothetical protein